MTNEIKEKECRHLRHDHTTLVSTVYQQLPEEDALCSLAELFSVFGDTTRIRILYSLFESELCVCAISELLHMTQSAISHQLKVLRDHNLVGCRREGKTVYYFLADDHVRTIIGQGYDHLKEKKEKKEHKTGVKKES